ncbi:MULTISPECIES: hypothetical protein [Aeromicrobium]|uniref:hypothetical protein n=1 Tax=Aeromicrobium TaxID=2040 RepID=UPI0006F2907B|nr:MULTISPECIES: hypothetical protein [Aeromicrobium]KQX75627.1 hypothetical protein ASD10_10830 [Aeromicrobium sp. Root472D3]MCL8251068.1 hypothetical protein [Aeromicrobium fastidiosum]
MKISLALAGIVLIGTSVAACTGGDGGSGGDGADGGAGSTYCQDIAAARPTFESLSSGDLTKLEEGFATFHRLADEAPDGLEDQWKTLDDAATSVEEKIKEAGLTFDDLPDIQSGKIPEGVSVDKLTAFAADLQKLNNSAFADARADISKQAKDVCDVNLGAS